MSAYCWSCAKIKAERSVFNREIATDLHGNSWNNISASLLGLVGLALVGDV